MTSRGPSRKYEADRWTFAGTAGVLAARLPHLGHAVAPRQGVPAGLAR
ncbi:hypothetical protein SPARM206S_04141 [Streptomyces parvulus]